MNVLNMIPVLGWVIAAIICFFIAIPIYFLWNWLAPVYFYWLPSIYLILPFWHVFGLLWLLSSLRNIILPSISATSESIKAISDGIKELRAGRLNDRALFLLIQQASPLVGRFNAQRISIKDIKSVFDGIESLESTYLKPVKRKP